MKMSEFAKIENGIVVSIIIATQEWVDTQQGVYVITPIGTPQTFAIIGSTYDNGKSAFISPKPFPSWVLNENSFQWEAPVKKPINGIVVWNEITKTWDSI